MGGFECSLVCWTVVRRRRHPGTYPAARPTTARDKQPHIRAAECNTDHVRVALQPKAPYTHNASAGPHVPVVIISEGDKPVRVGSRAKYVRPLPERPPVDLLRLNEIKKNAAVPLTRESYQTKLHAQLDLEEIGQKRALEQYDMSEAVFKSKEGPLLWLHVPGVREKRPSVAEGNRILMRVAGEAAGRAHLGYVHRVSDCNLAIHFARSACDSIEAGITRVWIRFEYSALVSRLCHRAIDQSVVDPDAFSARFFPSPQPHINPRPPAAPKQPPLPSLHATGNSRLIVTELNEEQTIAVACIAAMAAPRMAPFILDGPPGTGKTTTLVAAIIEVLARTVRPVLVCAPSNSAVDHLAFKLHECIQRYGTGKGGRMLRLQARSRPKGTIRGAYARLMTQLSQPHMPDSGYEPLPKEEVAAKDIVVCTLSTAASLYSLGLDASHFSHIFVDEAAQAHEQVTLCAITGLSDTSTQIVFAGDHKQLGPVIQSAAAERHGLGVSIIERLISTPAYSDRSAGNTVKLVRNYRAHAALLEVPSRLFYGGELIAMKSAEHNDLVGFRGQNFPICIHDVAGHREMREAGSSSWFNIEEVEAVCDIVRELVENVSFSPRVQAHQIAVITPYHKQAAKLGEALAASFTDGKSVRVGSVEKFQGDESRVVIFSTVRSGQGTAGHRKSAKLAPFVACPKRFNVAITRAQSLLVVVGNLKALRKDRNWNTLITWALTKGQPTRTLQTATKSRRR